MSTHGHGLEGLVPALDLEPAAGRADEYELERIDTKLSRASELEYDRQRDSSPMRRIDTSNRGRDGELGSSELPPIDGGRQAWLFVAAAFVLETTIWGYSFTFGIVQVYLHSHPPFNDTSLGTIAAVGTVSLAIQYMTPFAVIFTFQRYPDWVRIILWGAVVVSCGSMLLSSWANAVWQLIILQGVLGGLTGAILYAPVLLWLNQWFVDKRGTASGIVFAGTGIGGFAFPYFIEGCLQKVGFPWTCRIWALFTLIAFSGSLLVLKPRIPIPRRTRGEPRGPWMPADLSFLRSPLVIIMAATTFVSSLSFFPVSLYLPNFTESLPHATSLTGTTVLAIYNATSVIGQVLVGWLSDKYPYAVIVGGIGLFSGLTAFFAWGFADSLGATFAFAVLFGLFSGICSAWSACARDVAGNNSQTATLIFCCFGCFRGLASIIGPQIAAGLYHPPSALGLDNKIWGKYGFSAVIIFVGTMAIISAVGATGLGVAARRKKMQ